MGRGVGGSCNGHLECAGVWRRADLVSCGRRCAGGHASQLPAQPPAWHGWHTAGTLHPAHSTRHTVSVCFHVEMHIRPL
eukprot:jgi/Mesvir1/25615/Mv25913-RA.1